MRRDRYPPTAFAVPLGGATTFAIMGLRVHLSENMCCNCGSANGVTDQLDTQRPQELPVAVLNPSYLTQCCPELPRRKMTVRDWITFPIWSSGAAAVQAVFGGAYGDRTRYSSSVTGTCAHQYTNTPWRIVPDSNRRCCVTALQAVAFVRSANYPWRRVEESNPRLSLDPASNRPPHHAG